MAPILDPVNFFSFLTLLADCDENYAQPKHGAETVCQVRNIVLGKKDMVSKELHAGVLDKLGPSPIWRQIGPHTF